MFLPLIIHRFKSRSSQIPNSDLLVGYAQFLTSLKEMLLIYPLVEINPIKLHFSSEIDKNSNFGVKCANSYLQNIS